MPFITRYLNANLLSHVFLTRYFAGNVRKIASVSSVCAHFPSQFFVLYGGSKAFLESFYMGLA